jgi:SPP1 family predicted phage head-tail adaptor
VAPLTSGELTRRVVIQSFTDVDDGGGGSERTWSTVATVWAKIEPGTGREFLAAQQVTPELSHLLTIRYRTDVTAKCRAVYGSQVFAIHTVADVDAKHERLVLTCEQLQEQATEGTAP